MSEKRFTYLTGAMGVLFYDGDEMIPYPKVCEILNKVDEQQATISALKEENEQLRENLHNCRLNKNIIREKLKLWQDVHKEYGIYSINDFEELMKNDK